MKSYGVMKSYKREREGVGTKSYKRKRGSYEKL